MNKLLSIMLALFFSTAVFAGSCPLASDTNTATFCSTFKTSAGCFCSQNGYPNGICSNMTLLYNAMLARFGTVLSACQHQTNTPVQTCVDDWNCYMKGGKDSQGRLCSNTGKAC